MLERLGREAGGCAERAARPVSPAGTHRVRAVLDHRQAQLGRHVHEPVHVGEVAAHVGQEQEPGARAPGRSAQVGEVDVVVGSDADEHRIRPGVHDRARHGCQGEGVHQHRLAPGDTGGHQAGRHRRAAAVERHAVPAPDQGGEGRLELGDVPLAGVGLAVAEQAPRRHELVGPVDAGGRYGWRRREVEIDRRQGGHARFARMSAARAWPSMPSSREMRAATGAWTAAASAVICCQVSCLRNFSTLSPPV